MPREDDQVGIDGIDARHAGPQVQTFEVRRDRDTGRGIDRRRVRLGREWTGVWVRAGRIVLDSERLAVRKPGWIVHARRLRPQRSEVPPARVDDAHPDVRTEVEGDLTRSPAPVGTIGNLDILVLNERGRRGPALRQGEQIELRSSKVAVRFQHRALEDDGRAEGVDDATIVAGGRRRRQKKVWRDQDRRRARHWLAPLWPSGSRVSERRLAATTRRWSLGPPYGKASALQI